MTHTPSQPPEHRFGSQVRSARESRGWSQETLARHLRELAGVELHQTAIARLEQGKRPIRFNEASALAILLGLDLRPYATGVPQLTPEEYESAVESFEQLREQELQARDRLADTRARYRDEEDAIEREVGRLRDARLRIAQAIQDFEDRQRVSGEDS